MGEAGWRCEPTWMEVCTHHGKALEFFCKEHKARLCCEEASALGGSIRKLEASQEQLQVAGSRLARHGAGLREQVMQLFDGIQETLTAEKEAVLALLDHEEETRLLESRRVELAQPVAEAGGLAEEVSHTDFMGCVDRVMERVLIADGAEPQCRVERLELDRTLLLRLQREGQAAVRSVGKGIRDVLRQRMSRLQEPLWSIPRKMVPGKPHIRPKPGSSVRLEPAPTHFTLDPNTAHCNISVSADLLSAQWVPHALARPARPERFRLHPQVLCGQGLSGGTHTWQVEVGGTRRWEVGATCKSRDQAWVDSCISWALRWDGRRLQAFEGHKRYSTPKLRGINEAPGVLRVHLDCGQGTLSFFTAEDGLLHRFSIKPSGPVFPGFYLEESSVRIKKQEIRALSSGEGVREGQRRSEGPRGSEGVASVTDRG